MESSGCQGRRRKRVLEEEEDEENDVRDKPINANRTIVTRSMSMKKAVDSEGGKSTEYDQDELKIETNVDNKPIADEEVVEKKKDELALVSLDDWPVQWNWEQDLSRPKGGYEWDSYWETMDGELWILTDKNNKPFWNDEPWNYDPDDGLFSKKIQ